MGLERGIKRSGGPALAILLAPQLLGMVDSPKTLHSFVSFVAGSSVCRKSKWAGNCIHCPPLERSWATCPNRLKAISMATTPSNNLETLVLQAAAYATKFGGTVARVDDHILVVNAVSALEAEYQGIFIMSMNLGRTAGDARGDLEDLREFLAEHDVRRIAGSDEILWIDGRTGGEEFEDLLEERPLSSTDCTTYWLPAECFEGADNWIWDEFSPEISYGQSGTQLYPSMRLYFEAADFHHEAITHALPMP